MNARASKSSLLAELGNLLILAAMRQQQAGYIKVHISKPILEETATDPAAGKQEGPIADNTKLEELTRLEDSTPQPGDSQNQEGGGDEP